MPIATMRELLEAGVHFGHRTRRWNPKMRPYIFTERKGIHIIDLQQTMEGLQRAYDFARDVAAEGGDIIFVGTKRQAQENVREQAIRCGMPYVTQRWLGGTLTNFQTIRSRIEYMLELEQQHERGEFELLPNQEARDKLRELNRLHRRMNGLRNLNRLPEALFITDVETEEIAVREANRLDIPAIAMVDTNCDPEGIEYIIPANDDAIRSILIIASIIADAVIEGQQMRGVIMEEEGAEAPTAEGPLVETIEPVAVGKEAAYPAEEEEDEIIIIDDEEEFEDESEQEAVE
ncbi:MAG: 30S ribosomal protein S2 [Anaerolineae bacterium]